MAEIFPVVCWTCPRCEKENTSRFSQEKLSFHRPRCLQCRFVCSLAYLRNLYGSEYCSKLNVMACEYECDGCCFTNLIKHSCTISAPISQRLKEAPLPRVAICESCQCANSLKPYNWIKRLSILNGVKCVQAVKKR